MNLNVRTYKIFCSVKLSLVEKKYLLTKTTGSTVLFKDEIRDNPLSQFLSCEICFGNVPRFWVEQTQKLRWLQLESAGFESYIGLENNRNLEITNLKGFFSVPVAESAVAGILALYRRIDRLVLYKEINFWEGSVMRPSLKTLEGKKVLVLGAGAIGLQIKTILQAFKCSVLTYDKYKKDSDLSQIKSLRKSIAESDIIICCLPETHETIKLFDRQMLDLMQSHAIIVNVGRGSLLDEDVLIKKLNNGSIAGAILDVTSVEPLPSDHELWNCQNLILTQHTAGGYDNEITGKIDFFGLNYLRFLNGKNLLNPV